MTQTNDTYSSVKIRMADVSPLNMTDVAGISGNCDSCMNINSTRAESIVESILETLIVDTIMRSNGISNCALVELPTSCKGSLPVLSDDMDLATTKPFENIVVEEPSGIQNDDIGISVLDPNSTDEPSKLTISNIAGGNVLNSDFSAIYVWYS